jgi:hypothetical protein
LCSGVLVDIDAQSGSQRAVPFKSRAFVVAGQRSKLWLALRRLYLALRCDSLCGVTASLLPKSSTATCHCEHGRAWRLLRACVRRMAWISARVPANGLCLTTRLSARLRCIFAITRTMAVLPAEVRATFKRLLTDLTTAGICQPARNVF